MEYDNALKFVYTLNRYYVIPLFLAYGNNKPENKLNKNKVNMNILLNTLGSCFHRYQCICMQLNGTLQHPNIYTIYTKPGW